MFKHIMPNFILFSVRKIGHNIIDPIMKLCNCLGKMDLDNLDVDFIEDMMLKSKPLQSVLNDIRNRQKVLASSIRVADPGDLVGSGGFVRIRRFLFGSGGFGRIRICVLMNGRVR